MQRSRQVLASRPRPELAWGAYSATGPVREHNEDFAAFAELAGPDPQQPRVVIAAVADGMGGHAAGEIASRTAVEAFCQAALSVLRQEGGGGGTLVRAMEAGLAAANSQVFERAQSDPGCYGMGATLTAAFVAEDTAWICHVGDTRAYLVRNRRVRQLTKDHSIVQQKVELGLLTQEEAARSPERGQLLRAVGAGPTCEADIVCVSLQSNDALVLATDGAYASLTDTDFITALGRNSTPAEACRDLVNRAIQRDGADNATVACVAVGADACGWQVASRRVCQRHWHPSREALGAALVVVVALMLSVGARLAYELHKERSSRGVQEVENKESVAPPPLGRQLTLEVEVRGDRAFVSWSGKGPVAIEVGGTKVGPRENQTDLLTVIVRLREQFLPAQNQWAKLELLAGEPEEVARWVLSRSQRATSKAGLWVNDVKVRHRTRSSEQTAGAVISEGVIRQPIKSISFYLSGRRPIPVHVRFQAKETAGVGREPVVKGQAAHRERTRPKTFPLAHKTRTAGLQPRRRATAKTHQPGSTAMGKSPQNPGSSPQTQDQ